MKLISKKRQGSKVKKVYSKAQTPYQRLVALPQTTEKIKTDLKKQYEGLDPIYLLEMLKKFQKQLQHHAWQAEYKEVSNPSEEQIIYETRPSFLEVGYKNEQENPINMESFSLQLKHYSRTPKIKKSRDWKTRKDPFETVSEKINRFLQSNSHSTAKMLLIELIQEDPDRFSLKQLRTLQRRTLEWKKKNSEDRNTKTPNGRGSHFLSLALEATK
jgi:hypothetical protein